MVVTRARGVGEIVGVSLFEYKGSLEDVLQFGVGNEPFLSKKVIGRNREGILLMPSTSICADCWMLAAQSCNTTAKALVNAPGGEIEILLTVVIAKELRVERDDIVHIAVGHHHSIFLAQNVMPGTNG